MPERRRHKPARRHDFSPAMAATDRRGRPLEIADGFESGPVVSATNGRAQLLVADPEQDADALGRREREVKAGYSYRARRASQGRSIQRIQAREDAPQRVAADGPGEAERRASGADPRTACFGAAGVVLLNAVADAVDCVDPCLSLLEVVLGLAGRQLADRKHRREKAAGTGPRANFLWPPPGFGRRLDRLAWAPSVQGVCSLSVWSEGRSRLVAQTFLASRPCP